VLSKEELKKIEKKKQMNKILLRDYLDDIKIKNIIKTENGHKLAWPIKKTYKVN